MQTPVVTGTNRRRTGVLIGMLVLAVLALWFAAHIPKTIAIFLIAAFVASAVHPIVRRLEERRIPRAWAIAIVYAALVLAVIICALVVVPMTAAQVQILVANVPAYLHNTQTWLIGLQAALHARFPQAHIPTQMLDIQQYGAQRITDILGLTVTSLGAFALNLATAFFIGFSALILSFFFLLNHRQLVDGFAGFFPPSKRATARKLSTEAVAVFGGYISGQVIVSAITGVLIASVTAMFGFKYALLLGMLSAVAYAVPIVGMLAAHIVGFVLAVPQGSVTVIEVEAVIFLVARISDNVLVPKIMGGSVGVSPITVMFAVFAGGELFGLPGLILGIPLAAIAKLCWRYFLGPWLHGQIDSVDATLPEPVPLVQDFGPISVPIES